MQDLQATVMYEMSECSEDTVVELDVSIDDGELFIDESEQIKQEEALNLGTVSQTARFTIFYLITALCM